MPDHLHLLVQGTKDTCDVAKFVDAFKQSTGFHYKRATGEQLWQTGFYDLLLRKPDGVEDVAMYIGWNAVRKALCVQLHKYPLSGSETMDWTNRRNAGEWIPLWKKGGRAKARRLRNPKKTFRTGGAGGGELRGRNIHRRETWRRGRAGCDQACRFA